MIVQGQNYYVLNTKSTSYVMMVSSSGQLEHLYYGKKIRVSDSLGGLIERQEFIPGNNNSYSEEFGNITLNNKCLEISSEGKGDYREVFVSLIYPDGSRTSDFIFESASVKKGKVELSTLPSSYDETGEVECLEVNFLEKHHNVRLVVSYYVFADKDVITRTARIVNESDADIRIEKLMSGQLDIHSGRYIMSTFNGAWAREMFRKETPLVAGIHQNSSFTGTSSSCANPFFMIHSDKTTEDYGSVYGFNLIYSGNHMETAEVNEFGKLRILWGINPRAFSYVVPAGQEFEAPEAVMTFSEKGFNGMSQNMHAFVRRNIVRGEWCDKERPVLLNSWEAAYFKINEKKLCKLAKAGADVGIELFVMDDGWFGERDDDTTSLGDWTVNKKKLPGGVKRLADKINKMGLKFGIWVEPEMVSVKSKLYKAHPDWAIQIPGREHSEGRHQRMLDLGRTEVQDYIIEAMTNVFGSANIEYVKWDMNRTLTDIYSSALPEDRQGEVCHRYVMGLYRVMKTLTESFPDILFEGCAAGGNRFDLGILCSFPQIWGSDDTDAIMRTSIQTGYSYGYPQNCVGSHVSGVPNHQTLRVTPHNTRFAVAAFGSLGYETNLCDLDKEELAEIKAEIAQYKKYRKTLQLGEFYRGRSFYSDGNVNDWTIVSPDKQQAVGMVIQKEAMPNSQYQTFEGRGLDEDKYYHFYSQEIKVDIRQMGDLVNMVSPIHIKPGSFTQRVVAKHYKLDGDKEDMHMFGGVINEGVKLLPSFAGTGLNGNTRVFSDFAARVFYMDAEDIEEK